LDAIINLFSYRASVVTLHICARLPLFCNCWKPGNVGEFG